MRNIVKQVISEGISSNKPYKDLLVNNEEDGDKLWSVGLFGYNGSGDRAVLNTFEVYAPNDIYALKYVVAFLDREEDKGILYSPEEIEQIKDDYLQHDWPESTADSAIEDDYLKVDAREFGASQSWYIRLKGFVRPKSNNIDESIRRAIRRYLR